MAVIESAQLSRQQQSCLRKLCHIFHNLCQGEFIYIRSTREKISDSSRYLDHSRTKVAAIVTSSSGHSSSTKICQSIGRRLRFWKKTSRGIPLRSATLCTTKVMRMTQRFFVESRSCGEEQGVEGSPGEEGGELTLIGLNI